MCIVFLTVFQDAVPSCEAFRLPLLVLVASKQSTCNVIVAINGGRLCNRGTATANGLIVNPQVVHKWIWTSGVTVVWYWTGKREGHEEKPIPVPLYSPQITRGLTQVRTRMAKHIILMYCDVTVHCTRRPIHRDHFFSIVRPSLYSNHPGSSTRALWQLTADT
jgi:hypothetical protein